MEETETEAEQIVAEMVTGGADRGHLEQIEAEAEQIEAEMVTASLGGADRSRDGHRRSPVS